ncbi:MAG: hypothetical protein M9939_05140 [Mesorhizobium sp.]|nr:hypothetical protein [Mesorhizobium sp.]MCO5160497.1 hypothetical protein [Mesorhizobium sp.]
MDPIEQAIRNAFSKGNPEDPAFREKVYRSANAALEKALQANPSISPDAAERRRKSLFAAVTSIESEFVPAVEPVAPPDSSPPPMAAPPVDTPAPPVDRVAPPPEVNVSATTPPDRQEPSLFSEPERAEPARKERVSEWPAAPSVERPLLAGDAPSEPAPDRAVERSAGRSRRKGGAWGTIAGLFSFLIIVGLAIWIAAESGLLNLPGGAETQSIGTQQTPAGSGTEGEPRKPGEEEALENWIVVFSPDDPTTVAARAGAAAEVVEGGGEKALRISSGSSGAVVRFDVGQGTLERIAGKHAVFDIVARTGDGPETQMSVSCDFGALGDCGRNRYVVGPQRSEYLFQIDVPSATPGGAGVIEIQSDVGNSGKSVEILQIRVSTGAP